MTFLVHFAEFSQWLEIRVSGQDKQRKIHADGLVVRLPRRVHEGAIPVQRTTVPDITWSNFRRLLMPLMSTVAFVCTLFSLRKYWSSVWRQKLGVSEPSKICHENSRLQIVNHSASFRFKI